uniref:Uncharacterized protein n=1 Tax=Anguilla anguilla TaxID=7936 RepID=A0A0E9WYA0_ANGAN
MGEEGAWDPDVQSLLLEILPRVEKQRNNTCCTPSFLFSTSPPPLSSYLLIVSNQNSAQGLVFFFSIRNSRCSTLYNSSRVSEREMFVPFFSPLHSSLLPSLQGGGSTVSRQFQGGC